ncbi:OLC1v1006221C1 [Oldenlandia corymbosa var. corymbosa]|uniref:OLC1v1006221C1 n=1 Tax=Oldenlandia corymbosa var. corymbosa TaxID=529605 RepID=A0AAV1DJH3_OLDCO|nr:OLC1v1006221C1 [Oldenlandia corymbosa var. corymbosa]
MFQRGTMLVENAVTCPVMDNVGFNSSVPCLMADGNEYPVGVAIVDELVHFDDEWLADDWLLHCMFKFFESSSGLPCCVSEGNHPSNIAIEPGDMKEPNFSHNYNASSSEATILVEVHRCLNWVESTTFHVDHGGI